MSLKKIQSDMPQKGKFWNDTDTKPHLQWEKMTLVGFWIFIVVAVNVGNMYSRVKVIKTLKCKKNN
jgi:hypothetical protein